MAQQRRGFLKSNYVLALVDSDGNAFSTLAGGATIRSETREQPHIPQHIIVIEARMTFAPAATTGAQITIEMSNDGQTWDTEAEADRIGSVTVIAGVTVQKTLVFSSVWSRFYRLKIDNLDGVNTLTVVHIKTFEVAYESYWGSS